MTVKLNNGFAKVEFKKGEYLVCIKDFDGTFNLEILNYNVKTGFASGYICENKKMLSTINKYAKKYDVVFEL